MSTPTQATNLVDFDAPPPDYPQAAALPQDSSTSTVENNIASLTHELDNFPTSISEELAQTHQKLMTTPDDPFASSSRINLTAKLSDMDRILRDQINRLLASKDVRASNDLLRKSKALSERHHGLIGAWEDEEKRWRSHVELKERNVSNVIELDPTGFVPQLVDESGPFLDATNSRALSIGMEESGSEQLVKRNFYARHRKAIWITSIVLIVIAAGTAIPISIAGSTGG